MTLQRLAPLFAVTAMTVLGALGASPAHAETYRWCAYYTGDVEATNCGFSTYQQCMDTIFGVGGYCQENPHYSAPARPQPKPVAKKPKSG